ncbi:acyl-CoA thioesterase [Ruegeria arenilitoris]|uniref:acyl-CoA thioesterase n=1 Tax=Ruegeria arenilitoris TaxID=1173585 RepID=UPI00147C65E0
MHATSNFQSELGAGEAIQMETEILEIGTKSVTFRHTLRKVADGETAFITVFKCVLLNLVSRRAEELPDQVLEKAKLWMVGA